MDSSIKGRGMAGTRAAFLLGACSVLIACTTANIQPQDMSKLGAAPTKADIDKIAHGSPLRRLDYLVDDQAYTFEVYEATDTAKYYGLLFRGDKLIAVDIFDSNTQVAGPWTCMYFPPKPGLDVEDCLKKADQSLIAAAVDPHQMVAPDQKALDQSRSDVAGTVAETAVYMALFAPVMLPIAAITLPVMGVAAASDKPRRTSLDVKLGDSYADIRASIEQYPEKFRSLKDGSGTVLIPGAVVPNASAAFGVDKGKVIWIDLSPNTACGGGVMFWGMSCTLGEQRSADEEYHWRARTAPVMDHWENLAIYYSPPADYQAIGHVAGDGHGFTASSRMGNAIEGMKESARKEGATGVLVGVKGDIWGEPPVPPPPASTGSPAYAAGSQVPMYGLRASGFAIYVPADAEAFQKASQAHATTCADLSQKKDDAKDAYEAVEKTGTPAEVASAQEKRQSAEDASDAAFCGDDDWYAELMAARKH